MRRDAHRPAAPAGLDRVDVWEAEAAALPGEDGSLDWGRRWWEAVGGLERGGLLGSVSADIYKGSGGLRTSQVTLEPVGALSRHLSGPESPSG